MKQQNSIWGAGPKIVATTVLYFALALHIGRLACLLANSWAALTAIPFAYLAFRFFIREEERGLIETFGHEYVQYKKEVNAVFPKLSRKTN